MKKELKSISFVDRFYYFLFFQKSKKKQVFLARNSAIAISFHECFNPLQILL